ncbi:integrase, catalytic region, zinc finger, CCHC-type containing protein [Tanacetum coccineum]
MSTVRFGKDHFAAITRYGDYVQGNLTICHICDVEGLRHNLLSVGQFYDGDLEVAFHSYTCYVWNLEGDDLRTGSRDSNLYTISISEMAASSLVYLMSKATSTKSWLWHRRLSHLNFGPGINCSNFQNSSEELNEIPLKEDLDNLFGPLYEQYYATRTTEVSDNYTVNTLDNEDTPSSYSIIIEGHDAPQLVSSSKESITNEPTTPVLDNRSDEQVQEDVAELDGNTFMNPFRTTELKEAESSSNYQDPSNMYEFHQQHRFIDRWTKNRPTEQVIGDPSKHVTIRSRLYIDAKMCMYALTVSTTEPTNIKEAMLDHNWIESMQDELNQFKRLDVWELVKRPVDRNVIKVKWL